MVSLRQLERQLEREKEKSKTELSAIHAVHQDEVEKLVKQLQALQSDNNLLMVCCLQSSSSRMRIINHNWSAMKQCPHPQSVAEISRHSVLSGDTIRQCETSSRAAPHLND